MLIFHHRLTWMDVDYARVAHYLRYFTWVDEAFHGYLYDHGFHIVEFIEQGFGLPYLDSSCNYRHALTLEDEVEIQLSVTLVDEKGFSLRFSIIRSADNALAAEGKILRRCIQTQPPRSVVMPPQLVMALEGFQQRAGD